MQTRTIIPGVLCVLFLGGCDAEPEPVAFRSIEPVCIEEAPPADAWACGEPLVVDCNSAEVPEEILVQVGEGECADVDLVAVEGPFPPGGYDVVIVDDATDEAVCTSELTVVDGVAPVVETTDLSLWPPNHKMHAFALADCITAVEDCDPQWTAVIDYVASDEPANDVGDGNTEEDVVLTGPDTFTVRSERAGGGNGRVYTVAFTVTDGSGNATEAACRVVVDHDRSGADAIDDGEAYRVEP